MCPVPKYRWRLEIASGYFCKQKIRVTTCLSKQFNGHFNKHSFSDFGLKFNKALNY
jgi:hypothetical protein